VAEIIEILRAHGQHKKKYQSPVNDLCNSDGEGSKIEAMDESSNESSGRDRDLAKKYEGIQNSNNGENYRNENIDNLDNSENEQDSEEDSEDDSEEDSEEDSEDDSEENVTDVSFDAASDEDFCPYKLETNKSTWSSVARKSHKV
jgi:hypothetical protein